MAISKQRKRKIRRQTTRAARAEHGAELSGLRGQKRAARAAYRQDVRSTRGASRMLQGALSEAIRDARHSGLRGRALKDVVSEFAAQKRDATQILPATRAAARSELNSALATVNSQLADERAATASDARAAFADRIAQIQKNREDAASARRERAGSVKNATIAANSVLDEVRNEAMMDIPELPSDATDTDTKAHAEDIRTKQNARKLLSDFAEGRPAALRYIAMQVASSAEDTDQATALAVVRRMASPRGSTGRTVESIGASVRDLFD